MLNVRTYDFTFIKVLKSPKKKAIVLENYIFISHFQYSVKLVMCLA